MSKDDVEVSPDVDDPGSGLQELPQRPVPSLLHRLYDSSHHLLRAFCSSRLVIRRLFGVRIPKGMEVRFDPTTLLLSRLLPDIAVAEDRTSLEMGIGQGALISLSLALRRPIEVVGVDCSVSRVAQSLEVARINGIAADFFISDLFSEIPSTRCFDLILFNPPYVPTETGRRLRLNERFSDDGDQVWDGGADGTEVLSRFLHEAKNHLSDRGRIVFGVQNLFVPDALIVETIERHGLKLQQRKTLRLIPSVVYVAEKPR